MAVVTLTLDLPDDLANELMSMPEAERNRYVAVAMVRGADLVVDENDQDIAPTSEEDLAAIGRGLADSDAGRVMDADTFFAQMRRELGLRPRAK